MEAKIIRHRRHVDTVTYYLTFDRSNGTSCAFPCDRNGKVDVDALKPAGRANYEECMKSGMEGSIEENRRSYNEPAVLRCSCGEKLHLSCWTNTCDCGRDYNMSGQLLAPREQWGEETGEHWSDLSRI